MFNFFQSKKPKIPSFVESVEDYTNLKIVRLKGYLDISAVSEVQNFLKKAKKTKGFLNKSVILDLKNVAQVDSAVVAGLVKVLLELRQNNFKLGLMNVADNLKSMLQIMKLEGVFLVFESEKKAFGEILAWSQDWQ